MPASSEVQDTRPPPPLLMPTCSRGPEPEHAALPHQPQVVQRLAGSLPLLTGATAHQPGTLVAGRYTLLERIGEGGMGEVWVASQSAPVQRRVAIKLIKPGMDSRAMIARFRQERQALAMMDHPCLAKVLDAGETEHGRPFFVMELVQGMPLTHHCDVHKLCIAARVELFIQVCYAVHHAHEKRIIHRDLKPSNILVTAYDGRALPKVIDFGVAKATGGKLTAETLATEFGSVVGTLDYMAPEQAGCSTLSEVDSRADVYALGVVLYELVAGVRPFDSARLSRSPFHEAVRVLREQEPAAPSALLSAERLVTLGGSQAEPGRFLKGMGVLDRVAMRCLAKDRELRYDSTLALARDLQRYLEQERHAREARPPVARGRTLHWYPIPRLVAAALMMRATLACCGTGAVAALSRVTRGPAARSPNTGVRAGKPASRQALHPVILAAISVPLILTCGIIGTARRLSEAAQATADLQRIERSSYLPGPCVRHPLALARYRAGDWQGAIAYLRKSMELRSGGDSYDWFLLAMAHWQLGEKDEARRWYDKAVERVMRNAPARGELTCLRAEAAWLLGADREPKTISRGTPRVSAVAPGAAGTAERQADPSDGNAQSGGQNQDRDRSD